MANKTIPQDRAAGETTGERTRLALRELTASGLADRTRQPSGNPPENGPMAGDTKGKTGSAPLESAPAGRRREGGGMGDTIMGDTIFGSLVLSPDDGGEAGEGGLRIGGPKPATAGVVPDAIGLLDDDTAAAPPEPETSVKPGTAAASATASPALGALGTVSAGSAIRGPASKPPTLTMPAPARVAPVARPAAPASAPTPTPSASTPASEPTAPAPASRPKSAVARPVTVAPAPVASGPAAAEAAGSAAAAAEVIVLSALMCESLRIDRGAATAVRIADTVGVADLPAVLPVAVMLRVRGTPGPHEVSLHLEGDPTPLFTSRFAITPDGTPYRTIPASGVSLPLTKAGEQRLLIKSGGKTVGVLPVYVKIVKP